ncbi:MAG: ankyrin repeat domain-containing protein, partial [Burkholderiales bacterium]|nr:ankyrin repeat domain-containing protein [Burkholderiales bacterium]
MKKRVFLPVLGLMWVLALVPTMMFSTDLSAQNEELQRRRDERNRLIEEQKQQVRDQAGEVYLRFFSAVEQNRAAHVKAMLKQGVDVESVDAYGTPALLVAARSGNNEVVEALLD